MPRADAAEAVSLCLAGMIIGRLASSRLVQRFSPHQVVTGSLLIAGGGFLIYWIATAPVFGMVGLFITGLGVSSLYPLFLSLALGYGAMRIPNSITFRAVYISALFCQQ